MRRQIFPIGKHNVLFIAKLPAEGNLVISDNILELHN